MKQFVRELDEGIEVFRSTARLANRFCRPRGDLRVLIFNVFNHETLKDLLSIRDRIYDLPIILILPDNKKMTVLKGHEFQKKIIEEMSKVKVLGNEEGLIPAFGVFVQQLPAEFWNGFARRIVNSVPEDLIEPAEVLLVNAAHECGYHTGYGIITSDEWKQEVSPMIEKAPEDVLHGAFAVFTAWGWAQSEVIDIIPNEKMVVRAYDYYESDVMLYGQAARPSAYMIRGVTAAFMDLAYGGEYDPDGKSGIHTFRCEQTKGIEIGDDYGEFIVTRAAE